MGAPGDAIPSEPGRQVTLEDNVERNHREAEKNATKASLNLPTGMAHSTTNQHCHCYSAKASRADIRMLSMSLRCSPEIDFWCLFHAAGKQDLEAPAPAATGPKTYKAPAFDAPDSDNPKKAAPILESEAEFVRYRRQRTVHSSTYHTTLQCLLSIHLMKTARQTTMICTTLYKSTHDDMLQCSLFIDLQKVSSMIFTLICRSTGWVLQCLSSTSVPSAFTCGSVSPRPWILGSTCRTVSLCCLWSAWEPQLWFCTEPISYGIQSMRLYCKKVKMGLAQENSR